MFGGDLHRHCFEPLGPLPLSRELAVLLNRLVVAPARSDGQLFRLGRHEHAHANGRWELAAASGGWIGARVVVACVGAWCRQSKVVLLVLIRLLSDRRIPGNQKAGQVPARGRNGQRFGDLRLVRLRANQVQPEGMGQACADVG